MVKIGEKAPDFCLQDHEENEVCLKNFKNKWVVLYFYPKDNTPGCTTEACDFTENLTAFSDMDAEVIGISPDSTKSHSNFVAKYVLKHILLSDTENKVLEKYGVWKKKSMYGKEYMGVERTTFLIQPDGKIAEIWEKVKVKGHVEEVKSKLEDLR